MGEDDNNPFTSDSEILEDEHKETESNINRSQNITKSRDNLIGDYEDSLLVKEENKSSASFVKKIELGNDTILNSPSKSLQRGVIDSLQNLSISELNQNSFYNLNADEEDQIDNNDSLIEDIPSDNTKSAYKDDVVYLSIIYDSFIQLSNKFNKVLENKYIEKEKLLNLYELANERRIDDLKHRICNIIGKDKIFDININNIRNIIVEELPIIYNEMSVVFDDFVLSYKKILDFSKRLSSENNKNAEVLENIQEQILLKISSLYNSISGKEVQKVQYQEHILSTKKDNVLDEKKLKGSDDSKQIDVLGDGTEQFSYNKINVEQRKIQFKKLTSQEFNDEYDRFMVLIKSEIKNICMANANIKKEFDAIRNNLDIKNLNSVIEDNKVTIKKLRNENISFSEAVNKLSEKNIRLKKDYVILANEYNRLLESNKKRKNIIEKQRRMIDVFQKRFGDEFSLPVNEIQEKIRDLRNKLKSEKDLKKILEIKREISDYEKRIADFTLINHEE